MDELAEPTLAQWNELVLSLVQALLGAVSPNMRLIALRYDAGWRLLVVLERESAIDREEIDDIVFEFDVLQAGQIALPVDVEVDASRDLPWPAEPVRLVYRRREGDPKVRYRHLEILNGDSKPTDKEIKAIEAAVGAKLPPEFKAFLAVASGATVPYSVNAKSVDSDDPLNFREILWAAGDDEDTFLGTLSALRDRWNIPPRVLPFAREYGDSFALLDLRPQTYGAILALLSNQQAATTSEGEPVFIHLADSFDAYVDSLVPELSDEALGE